MKEKYELIISEKPNASKKIAEALADNKLTKKVIGKVTYYELEHNGKKIVVGCAVGHLYNLAEKDKKKGWSYPIFNYEWKPSYEVSKSASFSKAYLDVLKKLAKDADEFVVATDFDVEGSTIGWNIIRFVCNKKDGKRMKFSTLTKEELVESYENASKHLDFPQIESGVARHSLDWLFGLNLSRALTLSVKSSMNMFKILSTGRVQGPTLKVLHDREIEISNFKPVPYWELELLGETKNKENIDAWHKEDRFWDKKKAEHILKNCKNKKAFLSKIDVRETKQKPPFPFDLTSLQIEAYSVIGLSPHRTLEIAQELYTNGFISYPRTSSQKLPESIGYKKILQKLSKIFPKEANFLLSKTKLEPNNGKKEDSAHPAIYPTGDLPGKLEDKSSALYELIARRFFATFGDDATRETMTLEIDVNKEIFIAKGTRTKEKGWFELYGRFLKLEEEELPKLNVNDEIKVIDIKMHDKETKPPSRYNESSIIKEMEKLNIGTKCVTEDTLVAYDSGFSSISSDFTNGFTTFNDNTDISFNQNRKVFGFYEGRLMRSRYNLSSRRKLENEEKIHELVFSDGTNAKFTSDHPILVYLNGSLFYKECSKLVVGDKVVSLANLYKDSNHFVHKWDFFIKNLNFNKIYCEYNLKEYREKNNQSQYKLADILGVSQSIISGWESKQHIPIIHSYKLNYIPIEFYSSNAKHIRVANPFPLYWSSNLSALIANLLGDGSLDKEKLLKENCFDFRYSNTDLVLIRKFSERIFEVFGIYLTFKKDNREIEKHKTKYYIRVPSLIGRILATVFPELKNKNAPDINKEFYPEFLGALLDDEGHVNKKECKIFISNTNFKLLDKCKLMLLDLGIDSYLDTKSFKLNIYGKYNILTFLSKIPINSIKKKQDLIDSLSSHYKYGIEPLLKLEKRVLVALCDNELTIKQLSLMCCVNISTLKNLFYRLNNKFGVISKKIYGVSYGSRKITKYYLNDKSILKLYSDIGECVINENLISKTIINNKIVDYNGLVYDITNTEDIPNFALANGVIVHNSTRAAIVQNLFDRSYITEKAIQVTDLGMKTVETLEKYCPEVLDVNLTRKFEEDMDAIQENKKKGEEIIDDAKEFLTKALKNFKKHEKEIGKELGQAAIETRDKEAFIGKCPNCKEGNLQIRRGKYGMFAACDRYEKGCSTTFALPKNGKVKGLEKDCEVCKFPKVIVFRARRRPQEVCINPNCETKKQEEEKLKELVKDKKCPNCGTQLVVKSSAYGFFLACPGYPKCKYIENANNHNNNH